MVIGPLSVVRCPSARRCVELLGEGKGAKRTKKSLVLSLLFGGRVSRKGAKAQSKGIGRRESDPFAAWRLCVSIFFKQELEVKVLRGQRSRRICRDLSRSFDRGRNTPARRCRCDETGDGAECRRSGSKEDEEVKEVKEVASFVCAPFKEDLTPTGQGAKRWNRAAGKSFLCGLAPSREHILQTGVGGKSHKGAKNSKKSKSTRESGAGLGGRLLPDCLVESQCETDASARPVDVVRGSGAVVQECDSDVA